MTESPPERTETADPNETTRKTSDRTDTSTASVRSVVFGSLAAAAVAGAVTAFAFGGWLAVAGFGAVALVSPAVGRRIVKGPAKGRRAFGLNPLRALGRTKTKTSTGRLSWPLTGSQSRRALSKSSGTRGVSLPKLGKAGRGSVPSGLGKGKARRASAAGRGASPRMALPKHTGSRTVTAKKHAAPRGLPGRPFTTGPHKATAPRAAAKKPGAGPRTSSRTPYKTPARPGARPRAAAPAKRQTPGASRPATRGALGTKRSPKLSTGTARRGATRGARPGGKGNGSLRPITGGGKGTARKRGHLRLVGPSTRAAGKLGTKSRGGTGTKAARRLGSKRPASEGAQRKVPNRRPTRPTKPARRGSVPRLIRIGLGVPRRKRGTLRWRRPSLKTRRQARRALIKTVGVAFAAVSARFGRWIRAKAQLWDARVRGLTAPLPIHITIPATPPKAPPSRPTRRQEQEQKIRRKYRQPYPKVARRRVADQPTPKGTATVSVAPIQALEEAFAQLAQFDPENATEIRSFMSDLAHICTAGGEALSTLSQTWQSEKPLAAEVLDAVQQVAILFSGGADLADEANTVFLAAHANEIQRLDEPRPGEEAWDVTRNQ